MSTTPTYTLVYEGTDITADIEPLLVSVTLTDNLDTKADTLALKLDNSKGEWWGDWLPQEGDILRFSHGYLGETPSPVAIFEIDQITYQLGTPFVTVGAIATPFSKTLRQLNTTSFENQSLRAIAQAIADRHGLELVGEIPNITFKRVTQNNITDLEFLAKLSKDYGCLFKVENLEKIIFYTLRDLESQAADLTYQVDQLKGGRIKRKAAGSYASCEVRYQDAGEGKFNTITVSAGGEEVPQSDEPGTSITGDTLRVNIRAESVEAAKLLAVEALRKANAHRVDIAASIIGTPIIGSGGVLNISGAQRMDGKYLLEKVVHSMAKTYTTAFEGRLIE